jgi:hypothetical protein
MAERGLRWQRFPFHSFFGNERTSQIGDVLAEGIWQHFPRWEEYRIHICIMSGRSFNGLLCYWQRHVRVAIEKKSLPKLLSMPVYGWFSNMTMCSSSEDNDEAQKDWPNHGFQRSVIQDHAAGGSPDSKSFEAISLFVQWMGKCVPGRSSVNTGITARTGSAQPCDLALSPHLGNMQQIRQLGEARTFLFPGGLSKGASVVMQHIFVERKISRLRN